MSSDQGGAQYISCVYQGHDDATAIMLALNSPNIKLIGVSTVRRLTALRCLILVQD